MEKTLLILAAGMGSRFGGLKQVEPVGPNGEFIIDYSVYDAIRNGFTKVVFIIKKEMYDIFRDTIGKRIEGKIKVEYAFQELDDLPSDYKVPQDRTKPWGTAQAVLCAKDVINGPFAMINADDFYGKDAYRVLSEYMDNITNQYEYALVGYDLINTITENGSVKRGVCEVKDDYLVSLDESTVEKINNELHATSLETNREYVVSNNAKASMNMFVFTPTIFNYFYDKFPKFLDENINNLKSEFLVPIMVSKGMEEGFCKVKVINTNAKWVGVTYKDDKEFTINYINELIKNGEYKENLWN